MTKSEAARTVAEIAEREQSPSLPQHCRECSTDFPNLAARDTHEFQTDHDPYGVMQGGTHRS